MAAFALPLSTAGASYATVTARPLPTGDASVNTKVEVEPVAATDATVTGEPFTKTVKAPTVAVVERIVSL